MADMSYDVHPLDIRKIPGCTYSHPQIASVGPSEAQAKGYDVSSAIALKAPANQSNDASDRLG